MSFYRLDLSAHWSKQACKRKAPGQFGVYAVDEEILWFCQWWCSDQVISKIFFPAYLLLYNTSTLNIQTKFMFKIQLLSCQKKIKSLMFKMQLLTSNNQRLESCTWWPSYLILFYSYNALERRDACRGGKEAKKRSSSSSQSSVRSSSAAIKTQASHATKKNDGHVANGSHRTIKPATSSVAHAYDEQVSY